LTKRILIDGRFIGVGDSIARYTLELLRGVLALDKENEYTLLIRPIGIKSVSDFLEIEKSDIEKLIKNFKLPAPRNSKSEVGVIGKLRIRVLDIPHYSFAEQTSLLSYLNTEHFDLVHFTQFNHPIFYRGNYVVTIHDLILLKTAGNPLKKFFYNLVMGDAVKHSKKIISVSEMTKKDIVSTYGGDADKIETIYHGIDQEKFGAENRKQKTENSAKTLEKYGILGKYLLYVGAWKSHKNLRRLLEASAKVRQSTDIQLVLVGKIDHDEPKLIEKIESINNSALSSQLSVPIVLTGAIDINSGELPALYSGAAVYIMPSLLEGFGWPPLEAMACGTPVVASETSCIPEILGDAALYFDPLSVEDMANKIEKVLADDDLRIKLIEKGLKQSARYTWSETARKTYQIYQDCLEA